MAKYHISYAVTPLNTLLFLPSSPSPHLPALSLTLSTTYHLTLTMTGSTSLTEELRHAISNNRSSTSTLFSIGGRQNLSYASCWNILHLHKKWLLNQAISLCHDCNDVLTKRDSNDKHRQLKKNEIIIDDVVISYLADNSPDLLLSLLSCIDLTTRNTEQHDDNDDDVMLSSLPLPLPAMINVRWTPLEIQRALRVHHATTDIGDGNDKQRHHVTILIYGEGYEKSAKEAVQLLKKCDQSHYAVALPLPLFANHTRKHHSNDIATTKTRNLHHCTSSIREPDSDALILFTSGTSSPNGAKGVRLSHRSLYIQAHAKTCPPCNYDKDTRVVATTVPWFHVGGISSALAIVLGGGCFVFPSSSADGDYYQQGQIASVRGGVEKKGFDPVTVLQSLLPRSLSPSKQMRGESTTESIAANTLVVVPAMLHAMFQRQQNQLLPNHSVRLILVGGQSIGDKLYQQTREYFPRARIVQTYACTEAGSSITFLDLGYASTPSAGTADTATIQNIDGEKKEQCRVADSRAATLVGAPPRHIEIGIFDEKSDEDNIVPLPRGQMGIIGTRGSHVMSGYWTRGSDIKSNKRTQRSEDWMLTNDLGYIDGRNLYFCGRANDVIRTGGESVLTTEVEKVIISHPNVMECAVFALPDEKFGDAVCAALVLQSVMEDNVAVREDEVWRMKMRKHCERHQLAGFKRPRRVFCMDALPRNSSGKVLKYEIVKACASDSSNRSRL